MLPPRLATDFPVVAVTGPRGSGKTTLTRCASSTQHTENMSDLTPLPDTALGLYRHYKGGEYEVIGVARHSETHEPLVVYRPLYNNTGWWVRPHAMFFEDVVVDGTLQRRFEKIISR